MKRGQITMLNERELKYAALLEGSGLSRSMAMVIVCLMTRKNLTVHKVAIATGLTQASAGTALKKLLENGMVQPEERDTGKISGRHYCLAGDWKCILSMIEKRERTKIAIYMEKTGKVRKEIKLKYSAAPGRPR
jgi:predicted transcriptional regulator